jgi:hypothetical protein
MTSVSKVPVKHVLRWACSSLARTLQDDRWTAGDDGPWSLRCGEPVEPAAS